MSKYKPYFSSIEQLNGLGAVSSEVEEFISTFGEEQLKKIIDAIEAETEYTGTWSFDDVDLLYNRGITTPQKQAWVFYKRSVLKIPMQGGWRKYWLKGSPDEPYGTQQELAKLVKAGALFYSNGNYLPYAVFTWGNVYEREKQLTQDKDYIVANFGEQSYNEHYNAIQKAKPEPLRVDNPDVTQRAVIIPTSKFARTFTIKEVKPEFNKDVENSTLIDNKGKKFNKKKAIELTFDGETEYTLRDVFCKWLYTLNPMRSFSPGIGPFEVVNFYIFKHPMSAQYKENSSLSEFEVKKRAENDGKRLFADFISEVITDADIERLNYYFNAKHNSWSDLNTNAVPVAFEVSREFNNGGVAIKPEKREAIAYMEAVGSGILAYDVGVGKTMSALLELANAIHQGKCKRPLVVVPNPTYRNWIKEAFGGIDKETGEQFQGILSGMGYKYNDWYNLGSDLADKINTAGGFDKLVDEKTVTFVSYEGFMKIGFTDELRQQLIPQFVNILENNITDPELNQTVNTTSLYVPELNGLDNKEDVENAAEQFGSTLSVPSIKTINNIIKDIESIVLPSEHEWAVYLKRLYPKIDIDYLLDIYRLWNLEDLRDAKVIKERLQNTFGGLGKTKRDKAKDEKKIAELIGEALKDTICEVDLLGFDYIIIDEAHRCKKVFTNVNSDEEGNKDYTLTSGEPSKTALLAFCICNHIQRKYGRNVMLLTATPFTNSPLEIYSMLSLVGYDILVNYGYYNIREFFDMFAAKSTEYVVTAKGTVEPRQIIKGFNNRQILQKLIFTKINYKTGEDVGVKRPCKINLPLIKSKLSSGSAVSGLGNLEQVQVNAGSEWVQKAGAKLAQPLKIKVLPKAAKEGGYVWVTDIDNEGNDIKMAIDTILEFYLPKKVVTKANVKNLQMDDQILTYLEMNEMQRENQDYIYAIAQSDEARKNPALLLKILNASLDNAFSPYLFKLSGAETIPANYKEFVENSPKIMYAMLCIKSVKEWHQNNNEPVSGQVIYSNRGVDYFKYIKEYLIKEIGFKQKVQFEGRNYSEVMIIEGGTPQNEREFIKDAFNAGVVKVIIGSATIREGINLQKYGTVLYDLYPDWNPTDFIQLSGRIWRQGNKFGYVRIVMPLVEDSMDVFIFQKLEEKTARINDIFYRQGKANVLDLDSFDPNEIKYALIKDIEKLVIIDYSIERETAKNALDIVAEDYESIKNLDAELLSLAEKRTNAIELLQEATEKISSFITDNEKEAETDKETKAKVKYAMQLLFDVREFLKNPADDDLLMRFSLRIENYNARVWYKYTIYNRYTLQSFIDTVRKIRIKERTILKPKGYSINDDISKILQNLTADFEQKRAAFLASYGIKDENGKLIIPTNTKEWPNTPRWAEISDEIKAKKERLRVNGLPPVHRAKEFSTLNYLLKYKATDVQADNCFLPNPNQTLVEPKTCPPVNRSGERRIDDEGLKLLAECINNEPDTKAQNTDAEGNYTNTRQLLHDAFVNEIYTSTKPCQTQQKPIAILTGGAPGSGKTTFLKQFAEWVTDTSKVIHIDADAIREKLPEYKGWNAFNTQAETSDIVNKLLDHIGNPCEHDIVYDGTMNKAKRYLPLINKLKKLGYQVFVIYLEVPQNISTQRAMQRYQRSGRYVPIEVINEVYKNGLSAFNEVIKSADGYMRVDGLTQKIVEKGGTPLPVNRNYNFEKNSQTKVDEKGNLVQPKSNKLTLYKYKAKAIALKLKLQGK